MNMTQFLILSAYRSLKPAEKSFVDDYVEQLERAAHKADESIMLALSRPVPQPIIDASNGMFDRPMVCAAINERVNSIARDSELDLSRIVKELSAIAFARLSDYIIWDAYGRPTFDVERCTPEQMSAVKSIKHTFNAIGAENFEVILHDKIKALDLLTKILGGFNDDNAIAVEMRKVISAARNMIDKSENAGEVYAAAIE